MVYGVIWREMLGALVMDLRARASYPGLPVNRLIYRSRSRKNQRTSIHPHHPKHQTQKRKVAGSCLAAFTPIFAPDYPSFAVLQDY
jgi:hypothetical protein